MASPVSIGDALLLSKLAYRLGHAVTAGRKQAPVGIQEVKNQLYALGKALDSVAQAIPKSGNAASPHKTDRVPEPSRTETGNQQQSLETMLKHSHKTLKRMEALMSRYEEEEVPSSNNRKGGSKWRREAKTAWKNIKWTTETNEVDSIRRDLDTHVSSLNLLLAGMNHAQSGESHKRLAEVHSMMWDVHLWFTKNIKASRAADGEGGGSRTTIGEPVAQNFTFQLRKYSRDGQTFTVECPRASFRPNWIEKVENHASSQPGIFRCNCGGASHFNRVRYKLLPISLIVRVAQHRLEWQIFCAASDITSLYITGVEPQELSAFQEQIDLLAAYQVARSAARSTSTSSIYHSESETGPVASVLDCKSEMFPLQGRITSVTFVSGTARFTQRSINNVQIFHYRSQSEADGRDLLHQKYAEVVIQPIEGDFSNPRLTVQVSRSTALSYDKGAPTLVLLNVVCEVDNGAGSRDHKRCARVEFACSSVDSVEILHSAIQSVMQELQVQFLKYPRFGERIVGQREYKDIMIEHTYLSSLQAVIVFDPETQLHRLILRSNTLASCVTMELPTAFLKRVTDWPSNSAPIDLQATFVDHDREGVSIETRITQFPHDLLQVPAEEMERLRLQDE